MKLSFLKKFSGKKKQKQEELQSLGQVAEYRHFAGFRIFHLLGLSLLIVLVAITLWFIYFQVYQAIGKTQVLLSTPRNPTLEPIDFRTYSKVMEVWDKKTQVTTTPNMNPFKEHTAEINT